MTEAVPFRYQNFLPSFLPSILKYFHLQSLSLNHTLIYRFSILAYFLHFLTSTFRMTDISFKQIFFYLRWSTDNTTATGCKSKTAIQCRLDCKSRARARGIHEGGDRRRCSAQHTARKRKRLGRSWPIWIYWNIDSRQSSRDGEVARVRLRVLPQNVLEEVVMRLPMYTLKNREKRTRTIGRAREQL